LTFPEIYEHVLVAPLFRPFAEALLVRAEPRAGDSVIDVACGTGIVARLARQRLGPAARIVGVDLAPPMLSVARSVDATIDWRQGNVLSLPVGNGERFSLLTCHQGFQFFPDKRAALQEMRRVLAPMGRLAIATWRSLEDIPIARALNVIAEQRIGAIDDSRHSFGDAALLERVLIDGGFDDVRVESVTHDVRFADGGLFARLNAMAVIGMTEKGKTMPEPDRVELAGKIAADSQPFINEHSIDGAFVLPLSANIATGRV